MSAPGMPQRAILRDALAAAFAEGAAHQWNHPGAQCADVDVASGAYADGAISALIHTLREAAATKEGAANGRT